MNKLLSGFAVVFQFFPFVLQAIASVETVMGSAAGAAKKDVIFAAVAAAAGVGELVPELHVQVISRMIDGIVSAFNSSGFFNHAKSTPANPLVAVKP